MNIPPEVVTDPSAALAAPAPEAAGFVDGLGASLAAHFAQEEAAKNPPPAAETPPAETKPVEQPVTEPVAAKQTDAELIAEAEANLSKNKSPRAPQWEAVNRARKEAEEKLTALQKEFDEFKTRPADDTEKTALIAERDKWKSEYEAREAVVKAFDVQQSREFEETVNVPARQINSEISTLCQRNGLDASAVQEALLNVDPKAKAAALSEIVANLNDYERNKLYQLDDAFSRILHTREELIKNAGQAYEEIQNNRAKEAAAAKLNDSNVWKQQTDRVWTSVAKNLNGLLPEMDKIKSEVMGVDPDKLRVEERVFGVQAARLLPAAVALARSQANEIASLKASLGQYSKASPATGGPTTTQTGVDPYEGMTVADRINAMIAAGTGR